MASKTHASAALLITFTLLFFTLVSSNYTPYPSPPSPQKSNGGATPSPAIPTPTIPTPTIPTPAIPTPTIPTPTIPTPTIPTPTIPTPTIPTPTIPTPAAPSPSAQACPIDTLKLLACANVLSDLINIGIGTPKNTPCCTLIGGLADLDAAVCLCTAIKANVLGINLNVPVSLSLLLNNCGKKAPSGFQCS